jgi:hypothetical protein
MKIEVSIGEVADKITILEIKLERIRDQAKLEHVRLEYDLLSKALRDALVEIDPEDMRQLRAVNRTLWEVEDRLRAKQRDGEFDDEFIDLARSVYVENDRRFEIKTRINRKAGSTIMEEKEYVDYGGPDGA